MKKLISVLLSLLLITGIFAGTAIQSFAEEDKKISLLFIGNSYAEDCGREHLYQILSELGYNDIEIGILKIGYCSLDTHRDNLDNDKNAYTYFYISSKNGGEVKITENYSIRRAIESYDWEYVSLQQNAANSGLADTYYNAPYIYGKVSSLLPDAKLLWNMTWAYGAYSGSEDFAAYSYNQVQMYDAIVNAVNTQIVPLGNIGVIPSGTAIQNARSVIAGSLITRDEHHLSYNLGRYIAALTVAGYITGLDISGIEYAPGDISAEQKDYAVKAAKSALEKPYEITDLTPGPVEQTLSFFERVIEMIKNWFRKIVAFFKGK